MRIAIGSDHAGFHLKKEIAELLEEISYEYHDFGTYGTESCDYPDYAEEVAEAVADDRFERGILICATGIGMSMSANKVQGIRAALCQDIFSARRSREHNNANVLCLGAEVLGVGLALEIVETWLITEFSGEERHCRRVEKIMALEG